jgi:hypothetical protein
MEIAISDKYRKEDSTLTMRNEEERSQGKKKPLTKSRSRERENLP